MKPISLNVLLTDEKSDSLSFFYCPLKSSSEVSFDGFVADMLEQLEIQDRTNLKSILGSHLAAIKKILKDHPDKSHGFFISENLQGYIVLEQQIEPYCIIGKSFHVRPLLEEINVNPEFVLINVSLYDIKIYRGDFQHIEIIQQYEFDELPKNFNEGSARIYAPEYLGLIPYKNILALKTIAHKVMDTILYHSLPVIVTGLEDMKEIFLRFFDHSYGIISHLQEDFYEKTCVEIVERCKSFRHVVLDFYSVQLKERIKLMMKSKRIVTDLKEVIQASYQGKVVHLILPSEKKIWGRIDRATGEYSIDERSNKKTSIDILNELAEEVMKQGGKIQILGPHFFPQESSVIAILRGRYDF